MCEVHKRLLRSYMWETIYLSVCLFVYIYACSPVFQLRKSRCSPCSHSTFHNTHLQTSMLPLTGKWNLCICLLHASNHSSFAAPRSTKKREFSVFGLDSLQVDSCLRKVDKNLCNVIIESVQKGVKREVKKSRAKNLPQGVMMTERHWKTQDDDATPPLYCTHCSTI